MNPVILTNWIQALKSGDYGQGTSELKSYGVNKPDENKSYYCCLGVLCDVIDPDDWYFNTDAQAWGYYPEGESSVPQGHKPGERPHSTELLPDKIAELVGIPSDGEFKEYVYKTYDADGDVYYTTHNPGGQDEDDDVYSTLVSLNDDAGATFSQIADLLEREFEDLFE